MLGVAMPKVSISQADSQDVGRLKWWLALEDYFSETDWKAYNAKAQLGVVFDQTP